MAVFHCLVYCMWSMYDYELFKSKMDSLLQNRFSRGDMVMLLELGEQNSEIFVDRYASERENVWIDTYPLEWGKAHIRCRPEAPGKLIGHIAGFKGDCGAVYFTSGKREPKYLKEIEAAGVPVRRIRYFVPNDVYERLRAGEDPWKIRADSPTTR